MKKTPEPAAPAQGGYLRKSAPSGLRFAAPPKPPVHDLPPLPITYDPQPVFSPEFAQPLDEFPIPPRIDPPRTNALPDKIEISDLSSVLTNQNEKIPATISSVEAVSPLMLIKFFQDAKPAEVQMVLPHPISFRVPVREQKRSSSARYQVK